ncbi:MAG: pyruvate formate lyase family protein [Armatimonadota bacterium]
MQAEGTATHITAVDTQQRPSTDRIARLLSRLHKPVGTGSGTPYPYDWQEPGAEAWWATEGQPRSLRVAQVEAETWRCTQPTIDGDHLILGQPRPLRVVSTFYTCGLVVNEHRATQIKELPECTPEYAALLHRIVDELGPETFDAIFAAELARRGLKRTTPVYWGAAYQGHMVIDWHRVMRNGLEGLACFAKDWATSHTNEEGRDLARAALVALRGLQDFIRSHAEAAEEAARGDQFSQERREELSRLAAICRHIATESPRTFYEALQLFWFVFLYDGCDNPGRFDQYAWPFLRDDLAAGRLTREEALELLEDLWVRLNEVRGWNMALAGQTSDGRDATNELTYLCLEVAERLRLPAPNLSVRVFHDSPDRLWERTVEVIGRGMGMPAIYNDDVVVPALERMGVRTEDAREYAFGGCTEIQVPGKSNLGGEDANLNLAKVLELALNDGLDPMTGDRLGPATGSADTFESFEDLWKAYENQLRHATAEMIAVSNLGQRIRSRVRAKVFRSLLIDDCLPRGKDPDGGGALYGHGEVMTLGIAVTADALTAIKRLVYDEQRVSLGALVTALHANFEGYEPLRRRLLSQPKYGQGSPEADAMAARVAAHFWEMLRQFRCSRGGSYGGGVIVLGRNLHFGGLLGASADGRLAGAPVEDSIAPLAGRATRGPTAALMAAAGVDQTLGPMGVLCNLTLVPECFRDAQARAKVVALVKGYFGLGGQQVQITVTSAGLLRAAQRDPESHADLLVRIGGYSDYFVRLSPDLQEDIIRRTAYGV